MRLIDVDELLKTNIHIVGSIMTSSGKIQNIDAIQVIEIENAPTIDAVPVKHGKWLSGELDFCNCSVCGNEIPEHAISPYCDECGAKMDGEE